MMRKLRYIDDNPCARIVGARLALAGRWILDEALSILGDLPDVQRVAEDAVPTLPRTVQGR